ncbi:AAA family ATPase, partial [Asanoa siamensis]|uniref:AAA family ATPase n=1 Tax=Asanoa siamensis TaxID=926357 RepID=UPI001EF32E56
PRPVLDPAKLRELQARNRRVFVHHAIAEYVVRLVLATREPARFGLVEVARHLAYGASPRATLGLVAAARGLALLRGRDYVVPDDVRELATEVIAHRLVLSFDAVADGVSAESVVDKLVDVVPPPHLAAGPDAELRGLAAA